MTDQTQIERIPLGKTDVRITPLGTGTWTWGDRMPWSDRMSWGYTQTSSVSDLQAAFDASVKGGVDFFDTAEVYGNGSSEQFLGQFIRESGRQVVVSTKFMPHPWKFRRSALMRSLKASLDRLGLERVDLYLIHWPFPPRAVEVWAEELANAVDAGLVRAVGVSNYSVSQMERAHTVLARRGIPIAQIRRTGR